MLPPVRRSVTVPLAQQAAFDLFVRRIHEWWPVATRSVHLGDVVSCHIEPRVGGRVFEVTRQGAEADWGTVVAWDEPSRLAFTWHPGRSPDVAQEVEVTFLDLGGRTEVHVEHRNWERAGEHAALLRSRFEGGWPGVLARFEALARGESELPPVGGPGCMSRE